MSTEATPREPCTSFPGPGLRPITRYITTHTADGKATFLPEDAGAHHRVLQGGLGAANILYSTRSNPVDLTDHTDIALAAQAEVRPTYPSSRSVLIPRSLRYTTPKDRW